LAILFIILSSYSSWGLLKHLCWWLHFDWGVPNPIWQWIHKKFGAILWYLITWCSFGCLALWWFARDSVELYIFSQ
jgi:hypothetical protein